MENTLLSIRQHPSTMLPKLVVALFWSTIATSIGYVMMSSSWFAGLFCGLIALFLFLAVILYRRYSSRLNVTNRRLHLRVKTGLLSDIDTSITWEKIQDITFSQESLFHKLFHCGTLYVRSGSGDGIGLPIRHIPKDRKLLDMINDIWHLHSSVRLSLRSVDDIEKAIYSAHTTDQ